MNELIKSVFGKLSDSQKVKAAAIVFAALGVVTAVQLVLGAVCQAISCAK